MKGQELYATKTEDGFQVEYEILSGIPEEESDIKDSIAQIDNEIAQIDDYLDQLNAEIDRLTNHADTIDYIVAVSSGVITGLIDSFFVGEFDFKSSREWSNAAVEKFQQFAAKQNGYKGDTLDGAKRFLENKFKVPNDNVWSGKNITSATMHHLDDFAHHPTLLGMVASIVAEFFRIAIFKSNMGESDSSDGKFHFEIIDTDPKELLKKWAPILSSIALAAIIKWIVYIIENKKEDEMKSVPGGIKKLVYLIASTPAVITVCKSIANWLGHLASDLTGSTSAKGAGTGIPGIFLSLLKELSSVSPLDKTGLPEFCASIYANNDLRDELAIAKELGKQGVPVFINEFLVRGFYFIRGLCSECKKNNGFKNVDWKKVVPFYNRTIERMMTIATGTFCAVDLADAAIRAGIKSGGNPAAFAEGFVLRVNFVGIGRFAIAVGTDSVAGIKRKKAINEVIESNNKKLALKDAKIFYLNEGVWEEMKNTQAAVNHLEHVGIAVCTVLPLLIGDTFDDLRALRESSAVKNTPLKNEILEILEG